MVDERALEHVVDLAQVVLVGHPVAGAPDQAEHARRRAPSGPGRRPAPASSAVTGRLICHQVRTRSKPASASQRCWRSSPGERAGVDLLDVQPAGGADRAGLASAHSTQDVGAAVGDVVGQVALDDVDEEHPAHRAVVDAAPGLDRRRRRRGPRRSRASAGRARRPRRARRRRRAPAQPRPCRSWARSRWVSRATSKRSAGSGVPTVQPSGSPGRSPSRTCVGVALEPVVLGDHIVDSAVRRAGQRERVPPTRRDRDVGRPRARAGAVASGVRGAPAPRPARRPARRGATSSSCSSSATRTIASAARVLGSASQARRSDSRPSRSATSARRASALSLRVASAARCWAAVSASSSSSMAASCGREPRLHVVGERGVLGGARDGEVAVGLRLLGPVAGGVAPRLRPARSG